MQPPFFSFAFGSQSPRWASKIIFFLFVLGGVLFCAGFALSIFGFQSCQSDNFSSCSMTFKVLGPSLAVIGLASLLMARSRARLERRRRELAGDQTDPDSNFLCGESRQFIQYLIFGILFVICGILISVLGVWIPGCNSVSQNVNGTDATYKNCGFLSLQIMGPVIVLIGLCFFVAAHIKKKHNLSDANDSEEEPETPTNEPFHITVGDAVIIFPPPPPPYFAETPSASASPMSENPPSYSSIFNIRPHHDFHGSERENIYTISLPSQSTEVYSNAYFPSEPPPKYEEKDSTQPDPIQTSSPSSSSVPDDSQPEPHASM
ncbi:transmembrane protein 171-like [Spea bombifrons]|uniref:transmembrane protein 171-like n=1 Tax=Spea bombifrons TaxID=233779 RepID=UPI002349EDB5|nr:transmembrane protein 171-like [Spea bombifrons]